MNTKPINHNHPLKPQLFGTGGTDMDNPDSPHIDQSWQLRVLDRTLHMILDRDGKLRLYDATGELMEKIGTIDFTDQPMKVRKPRT